MWEKKSEKLKHLFLLLSTFHYLEVLIAECKKIMSYTRYSITTLTRFTTNVKTLDDMTYMKNAFSQLDDERQKRYLLM